MGSNFVPLGLPKESQSEVVDHFGNMPDVAFFDPESRGLAFINTQLPLQEVGKFFPNPFAAKGDSE